MDHNCAGRKALILGIGGQDGSYLAEYLLSLGYTVHGLYRRTSTGNLSRVQHLIDRGKIILHRGDLLDIQSIRNAVISAAPVELYNFADQDHVDWSIATPIYSNRVTKEAVTSILMELSIRNWPIRMFQPLSMLMFGCSVPPQDESTKPSPSTPYAEAKEQAWRNCIRYRGRGVDVRCAIFGNHDSTRRGGEYLLHKICSSVVRISTGRQRKLAIGNLDAKVDIGWAPEYVQAAHEIMQLGKPDDYVICTGQLHTIREIVDLAFGTVGLVSEGRVVSDPLFNRPGPVPCLTSECVKARTVFGWNPKCGIKQIINLLVEHYGLHGSDSQVKKEHLI